MRGLNEGALRPASSVVKVDSADGFRLEVSAYSPMLCQAWVNFEDDREPIWLERYIDF
jgi:hypothetical protein